MENNMNNERKNGSYGVFYGVIGVATLIVTIIGATFAFFTAQANSAPNAIQAGGANVSLQFAQDASGLKTDLIPIDETLTNFKNVVGPAADDCKDINGNEICSVYTFTITNPGGNTANLEVFGSITPESNTFTNLWMAVFKGTPAQIKASTNSFNVTQAVPAKPTTGCRLAVCDWGDLADGTIVYTGTVLANGSTAAIPMTAMQQVLIPGESEDYTVVLWVHETGAEQNADQGKAFKGGISFTTQNGSTGITGVLAA